MSEIIKGNFADEMKNRYLTYALSTIMSRAVPDVRDGMKPVQRRLLYAMRMLRLDPDKGYKKCARVVGDVIGKYHPHGDTAVYDAMVRLAQDFSLRYPMVDGMGNFGSIDGDSAAAMRYTEARLTKVAMWMMRDMEAGTIDYRPTYDGSDEEPMVLPACFPNLLANGTNGIAVGMATSIPPHNVGELCRAMQTLLKNPESSIAQLMRSVKGPDFPTGGVLAEDAEDILAAYETGRGSLRVRAKWEVEKLDRGQYQIVITEIPFQVQKSKIIEKIADLINGKKVPWLTDVRDESAETIRVVLEPKNRTVDPQTLMNTLFRLTELESRFALNMNVIKSDGTPGLVSLKEALQSFLDHRRDVLLRKSRWRMQKIAERLHLLDAYRVVYLNIDEVIAIIKENDEPAPIMMARFGIDDIQAEAILNMRLRRLRKLEEIEIRREYDELTAEQADLQTVLESVDVQNQRLLSEVQAIEKEFADDRRTLVEAAPEAMVIPLEAQIEKEAITVVFSQQGWVRAMKGHVDVGAEFRFKEGDGEAHRVPAYTTDQICFFTSDGKAYTVHASKLPDGRGFGEPLNMSVDIAPGTEVVSVFVPHRPFYLVASRAGLGFIIEKDSLLSQTKNGRQVMNLAGKDKAAYCVPARGDMVATSGSTKRLLVFDREQIPVMGRGKGVKLMELKGGSLEDICVYKSDVGLGLRNTLSTKDRVLTDVSEWLGKRAQVGKVPPHGFTKECLFFVPEAGDVEEDTPEPAESLVAKVLRSSTDDDDMPAELMTLLNEKEDAASQDEGAMPEVTPIQRADVGAQTASIAPSEDQPMAKMEEEQEHAPIPIVRAEDALKPAEKHDEAKAPKDMPKENSKRKAEENRMPDMFSLFGDDEQ